RRKTSPARRNASTTRKPLNGCPPWATPWSAPAARTKRSSTTAAAAGRTSAAAGCSICSCAADEPIRATAYSVQAAADGLRDQTRRFVNSVEVTARGVYSDVIVPGMQAIQARFVQTWTAGVNAVQLAVKE